MSIRWTQADVDRINRFAVKVQMEGIAMMRAGLNKADTRDRTPRKSRVKVKPQDGDLSAFGGFTFRLPWAPSVNGCYFNLAKRGRARTTRAREFEAAAMASIQEQNLPKGRIAHPMRILVEQHACSARGDIDNGLKIVLDCLKKYGVIADDNREIVKEICVRDGERSKEPWVQVTISAVTGSLDSIRMDER